MALDDLLKRELYSRGYQKANPPSPRADEGFMAGAEDAFKWLPQLVADAYATEGGVYDPEGQLEQARQGYLERQAIQQLAQQQAMQDPNYAQGYTSGSVLGGFVDPIGNAAGGIVGGGVLAMGRNLLRGLQGARRYAPMANEAGEIIMKDGKPRPFYHGTTANFTEHADSALGSYTEAPSAGEGHFFAADPDTTQAYSGITDSFLDMQREFILQDMVGRDPRMYGAIDEANRLEKSFTDLDPKFRVLLNIYNQDKQMALQDLTVMGYNEKNRNFIADSLKKIDLANKKVKLLENRIRKEAEGSWEFSHTWGERAGRKMKGGNTRKAYLDFDNPFEYDYHGVGYREKSYYDLLKAAKADGHDSAILRNTKDGGPVDDIAIAFDTKQIIPAWEYDAGLYPK